MTAFAFNVWLDGKLIDTVFYSTNGTIAEKIEYVRDSLIGHDGYSPGIKVTWPKGQRVTRTVYDLEGDYGQGFETLCSGTFKEMKANKKEYMDNAPCPLRIVRKMERV